MSARPSRTATVGAAITAVLMIVVAIGRWVWISSHADLVDAAPWATMPSLAWLLGVSSVAGLAASGALLVVDARPRIGIAMVAALSVVSIATFPVPPVALVAFGIGIVLAVRAGAGWWAAGCVVLAPVLPITGSLLGVTNERGGMMLGVGMTVVLGIVLIVSLARRARGEQLRRAMESAEERRRTESERERVRMARELHDVLAHSLSSISVQANVALHLADRQPERTRDALEGIRDTSRAALDEVRQVLGVLRGDETGPLVPEPDLDALDGVVDDARRLGLDIEVDDTLRPRPGAAVQSAIVRIVREALTNAGRHAPGATVRVRLATDGDDALVEVRDTGPAAGRQPEVGAGAGRGILGMRERATLLGGSLDAHASGGGFVVAARLPIETVAETPSSQEAP